MYNAFNFMIETDSIHGVSLVYNYCGGCKCKSELKLFVIHSNNDNIQI